MPHISLLHSVYLFHIFVISLMGHVVYFSVLSVSRKGDQVLQCVGWFLASEESSRAG
jgi:hypothetical protein